MKRRSSGVDFGLLERLEAEPIHRWVLPNGLTLVVREDHSAPVVAVQAWVRTGSIHEGQFLGAGISHFVEHMLFKGTTQREGRALSRTVQEHGGNINAYTTFDRTVYYIDLPAAHVGVALDLLADMVFHSTFPADEVQREREVILREIDMGQDDPDHRFSEALFATAYQQHPHKYPVIGYKEAFARLTREDLLAYYRARYHPAQVVVVVAGAVEPDRIREAVEATWGKQPRVAEAPVLWRSEPLPLAPRETWRVEPVEVAREGLAWPIPGLAHPDAPALDVLAGVLGGGESSRLWQVLREKAGLVHAVDAHSWTPMEPGLFTVSLTCAPDRRAQAVAAVEQELARAARRGFRTAELAKVLQQMVVQEVHSRRTVSGQAARLGMAEAVVGALGYTRGYFARLREVTSAELVRVLRTYLRPDCRTRVSLAPATPSGASSIERTVGTGLEFSRWDAPNGARLLWQVNRKLPQVHLRAVLRGGASGDPQGARGLTALMATLMTKDTRQRSSADVSEAIEGVGGSFFPFCGLNSFGLATEVLRGDLPLAFSLLSQGLQQPTFLERALHTEREAQIAQLRQEDEEVVTFTRRRLRERFFGDHPLAADAEGRVDDLSRLGRAEVRAQWQRTVHAQNLVLVIAGDFEEKVWLPRLQRWLARLPQGTWHPPEPGCLGAATPGAFHHVLAREQAVVTEAFPGPSLHHPDYLVGEVMDELLSGMSSRLFERVREEKGLAYFVRSSRTVGVDTGMFSLFAGTHPAKAAEVVAEFAEELARLSAGEIDVAELRRCQTRLQAGRVMGLQTNASRAMLAALNTLYGYPLNDWLRYDERIEAITVADLQRFARTYFRREHSLRWVVGPEDTVVPAGFRRA